ncbi:hypothetical protein DH2020_021782 [Rehmannia glutinosa]|uniref:Uncharacterized protein n=1 Tax=Rehmannia glutinosa TaxID=99300 RepID=A0ABR0WBG4_REHGL
METTQSPDYGTVVETEKDNVVEEEEGDIIQKDQTVEEGSEELNLNGITIQKAKNWFSLITTSGAWLEDDHVDLAMTLLWERQTRYPKSFKYTRAILHERCVFYSALIFEHMDYKQNPTNHKFDQGLINFTNGTWSKFGREWIGCTHLYFPICYNKHCIAAELVFETSEVNIYDHDKGCLIEGQLNQCLEPVTVMFPLLAQQVRIKTNGSLKVVDRQDFQAGHVVSDLS